MPASTPPKTPPQEIFYPLEGLCGGPFNQHFTFDGHEHSPDTGDSDQQHLFHAWLDRNRREDCTDPSIAAVEPWMPGLIQRTSSESLTSIAPSRGRPVGQCNALAAASIGGSRAACRA
jgi:hypothetical protein